MALNVPAAAAGTTLSSALPAAATGGGQATLQHLGEKSGPEFHIGLAHTGSSSPMFWDGLEKGKEGGGGGAGGERGHGLDSG